MAVLECIYQGLQLTVVLPELVSNILMHAPVTAEAPGSVIMSSIISLADLEEGQRLEGDSKNIPFPPGDFDMRRFHKGRVFFREHIFCCSFAMFFSLVLGMCFPNLLQTLVFTGYSDTSKKAFKRYISTFHHMALWHYGDVWQEGSKANKSILAVRELHRNVAQKMKDSQSEIVGQEYISQYDMGIVQSGFMGLIVMYPTQFGIKCSMSDLDDYVYFWYGIGHLLGIGKEYNICAYGYNQAYAFSKEIEDMLFKNMQSPPPEFQTMTTAVLDAFRNSPSLTLLTLPVVNGLICEAMSRQYAALSLSDNVRFYVWKFLFYLTRHFKLFRAFLRICTERVFNLRFTPIANCR